METSALKITFRSLLKHKTSLAVNIVGLSLGMTCSILIMLFVVDELSYDTFHEDSERIYRLRVERFSGGGAPEFTSTASGPMLPAARRDAAQIEAGTRLLLSPGSIKNDDVTYFEELAYFADAEFFEVFTFNAVQGNLDTALVAPDSLVLSESTARRYFGRADVVGELLETRDRVMTVRAVIEDVPPNSHFDFDMLASFATLESINGPSSEWGWWNLQYHTYLKLLPGSESTVADIVREMPSRYVGQEEAGSGYRQFLYLQPLESIHLNSNYRYELGSNSSRETVFVFAAIAVFVLLIAGINFVNLSTARSADRAKEVGLRKTLGAEQPQLIRQFLGESVIVALLSLLIALVAIQLLLPSFNALAEKSLSMSLAEQWPTIIGLVIGALVVGITSGLYPAFVLSSFVPGDALKAQSSASSSKSLLRQSLVVLQFAISVMLIVGALVAQRQLDYMLNADMGFDKKQTLVINANNNESLDTQLEPLRESLLSIPGISHVTASASIPGRPMPTNVADLQRGQNEDGQTFYFLPVDHDFVAAYGLEVISGRGFSREYEADADNAFLLNEAAVAALGFSNTQDPIGRELTRQFGDSRNIIGVMRDFNYESLQTEVEPLVLYIRDDFHAFVSIKLSTENLTNTIAQIERIWETFEPELPFEYFFLSEDFEQQYHLEVQICRLLQVFTFLAIVIACLGLFALATFTTEKRRKEIGVRKVLGASVSQLVALLTLSFSRPVLIAAAIAVPTSYLLSVRWLNVFAYRIDMSWDIFAIAVVLALLVAMITVAGQTVKAALSNPTQTIRTE